MPNLAEHYAEQKRAQDPNKHLSLDEIVGILSEIGRDEAAGADRFRALRMLAGMNASNVTLGDPMDEADIVDRLARVMKPAGKDLVRIAYQRAFPYAQVKVEDAPSIGEGTLSQDSKAKINKIRGLRSLYRQIPEMKRPGFPPGYPVGKDKVVQAEWCRREAMKFFIAREQEQMKRVQD